MHQFLKAQQQRFQTWLTAALIYTLKMSQFQCRGLTPTEIQMAQSVFADLIDYTQIKIFNTPYLPWQPYNIFIAPNGHLFVHPQSFRSDYAACPLHLQGIFIHELTHILQHQQHRNVILKGALLQLGYYLSFKYYNPYHYQLVTNKPFHAYNIEQQGEIARDIFLGKLPNIILKP